MTQIQVIRPYKYYGQWVFDDENSGLVREALISGAIPGEVRQID